MKRAIKKSYGLRIILIELKTIFQLDHSLNGWYSFKTCLYYYIYVQHQWKMKRAIKKRYWYTTESRESGSTNPPYGASCACIY